MKEKQADKIIWEQREVPLSEIKPNERNPRTITRQQFAKLKDSLTETGYHARLLCDPALNLIGGHMRLKAMQELGFTHALVLVPSRKLTHEESQRVAVQDNIAFGEWDLDIIASDFNLTDLQSWGMGEDTLKFAIGSPTEGFTDPDDVPTTTEAKTSVRGDIWVLGNHRLMVGDSTKADDVAKLMDGAKPHLMVTDPPYGVKLITKNHHVGADFGIAKKGKYAPIVGDEDATLGFSAYETAESIGIKNMIIWGGNYFADQLPASSCWLVWDKRVDSGIKNSFADCELAWTSLKKPSRVHHQLWNGMIREGEHEKRIHPTQKPVALLQFCLEQCGDDEVFDPFSGSGTTIIAAEMIGRKCLAIEIAPQYVDMAIIRWQNFTKKDAIHMTTGKTFNKAMAIKNAAMKATG